MEISAAIPVFYDLRMVAENASDFSPSAEKPREVVASWQQRGSPIRLMPVVPATPQQLSYAHDATYVREILAGVRRNGFENHSPAVAASLPFTSGAMLSAARYVLAEGGVAAAPCSGFHHAGWKDPAGFCTFNGLMVTAMALLIEGAAKKIGILDADQHYGDGTDEIIERLNVHDQIPHVTFGRDYRKASQAVEFLQKLPDVVRSFRGCDLVLYQAGADPHINDPLGGWLNTSQLRERDRRVFATCREIGLPIVWNLAGGYQRDERDSIRPVLDIHDNTMAECVGVYLQP